jgi:mannose-6-phosphate isomerase-like protein (cupin superfamily)
MTASLSAMPTDVLGGVGLTFLKVYEDRPAPDGLHSGCAHVHAITDEAYFVVAGEGYLELHDLANGFRRAPLSPGAFVQFSPGTVHRVVSTDGLEVMVTMGNAGLPERGDARIYFGPEVDADPEEYKRLAALPKTKGREGALERRDASVTGYTKLMDLMVSDEAAYRAEIARFVEHHFAAMAAIRDDLSAVVEAGPVRWAQQARDRIEALPKGPAGPKTLVTEPVSEPVLGMCGILRPVSGLHPLAAEAASLLADDAPAR